MKICLVFLGEHDLGAPERGGTQAYDIATEPGRDGQGNKIRQPAV